jgi:DNA-binding IclR family transcriptional regulator
MPDDIYRTATGRIIMANMDKSDIKGIFEKNGIPPEGHWDEVSSLETLEAKLSELDRNGIAQTYCIREDGKIMLGYAAAIFRYSKCVGAIGVAVLCTQEEYKQFDEKEKLIKHNIIKARAEIGRRLKYS